MSTPPVAPETFDKDVADEPVELVGYDFGLSRRGFVQLLGAGLLITVSAGPLLAQERDGGQRRGGRGGGRGGGGARNVAARVHIGREGIVTVMTGKVEGGQGARAELTQAAAEELRLPAERVRLLMADTAAVPDDGITAGSRSTPSTVPSIRQGCAAARNLLVQVAAKTWSVATESLDVRDGKVVAREGGKELSYADLASQEDAAKQFQAAVPQDVTLTPLEQWKVLGASVPRPNRRDLVTGAHQFPSDVRRPGMLYGKVLRPPGYGAKLTAVDLAPAKAIKGVAAVHDGSFVGVAAPSSFTAQQAVDALEDAAKWETAPHPNSNELYNHLRRRAQGGIPANPFADEMSRAAKTRRQTYTVAYVQHAPMEPRAAVAEWENGKLTVWTATQNPFGVRRELAGAFRIPEEQVRVIVPDFGGGFGGKHTGECAVEAARLAKGAGKPVCLRWTREEEFTWAYFRPAAVIDAEAALDDAGKLTCWHFVNVNSGGSSIDTPYRAGKAASRFVQSEPPLRHGSYRALAATANTFARECFMDELAEAVGMDPLSFRQDHLDNGRLRAVLEEAAKQFDFIERFKTKQPGVGVGIACGTEKNSFVATCAEVAADANTGAVTVRRLCTAYECGKILNPSNLLAQVQGCVIQALGPALREEIRFEGGRITNAAFASYDVPRFADVPPVLDVHLLDRPDLPPVGAGETPLIAAAPAIANAVHHATGVRVREMPMRLKKQA